LRDDAPTSGQVQYTAFAPVWQAAGSITTRKPGAIRSELRFFGPAHRTATTPTACTPPMKNSGELPPNGHKKMWRALFLALGFYTCLLGGEALILDKAVLRPEMKDGQAQAPREIIHPEWAGWSLMATGAVVVLYSFTIPQRVASK
jgi:hypothetical protein